MMRSLRDRESKVRDYSLHVATVRKNFDSFMSLREWPLATQKLSQALPLLTRTSDISSVRLH